MKEQIIHPFKPIFDKESKVLILGSFPSPKSREIGFYYGHPKNRFWKILSKVFEEPIPLTIKERTNFVLKHHIALWDVIKSCNIKGASDSSISNVVVNDMNMVLEQTKIQYIVTTGKKADALYQKYCFERTKIKSICLPSTSPANCAVKEETLVEQYQKIKEMIK